MWLCIVLSVMRLACSSTEIQTQSSFSLLRLHYSFASSLLLSLSSSLCVPFCFLFLMQLLCLAHDRLIFFLIDLWPLSTNPCFWGWAAAKECWMLDRGKVM